MTAEPDITQMIAELQIANNERFEKFIVHEYNRLRNTPRVVPQEIIQLKNEMMICQQERDLAIATKNKLEKELSDKKGLQAEYDALKRKHEDLQFSEAIKTVEIKEKTKELQDWKEANEKLHQRSITMTKELDSARNEVERLTDIVDPVRNGMSLAKKNKDEKRMNNLIAKNKTLKQTVADQKEQLDDFKAKFSAMKEVLNGNSMPILKRATADEADAVQPKKQKLKISDGSDTRAQ